MRARLHVGRRDRRGADELPIDEHLRASNVALDVQGNEIRCRGRGFRR